MSRNWIQYFFFLAALLSGAITKKDANEEKNSLFSKLMERGWRSNVLDNLLKEIEREIYGKGNANKQNEKEQRHDVLVDQNDIDPNGELFSLLKSMSVEMNGRILKPKGLHEDDNIRLKAMESEISHSDQEGAEERTIMHDRHRRNLPKGTWTWPKNIVPFEIDSSIESEDHRDTIKNAMTYMANVTCVRWLERSETVASTVGHDHYVRIFNGDGCWASQGYLSSSPQSMSLSVPGCIWNSVALHEMMHSMGFSHEQSRSDRDDYLTVNFDFIQEDKAGNYYKDNTYNLNPYDLESLMHYGMTTFGINDNKTMTIHDKNLESIVALSDTMTYYDIADVLRNYNCSATCNKTTSPTCKFGILNHRCRCHCMRGFTGANCEAIISDSDCGGYVDLTFGGGEKYITSPNYPNKYPTGKLCRWVVSNPKGWVPRLVIEDLHLTFNPLGRCYNWLEIQYNLPGQTGIRKCGEIIDETWIASKDSGGIMVLTFDSNYVTSRPAQRGFRLRVDAVGRGCMSNPCVYGRCEEGDLDCDFKCKCDDGFTGTLCDTVKDVPNFKCSFEIGSKCIFQNTAENDDFQWAITAVPSSSAGTGPSHAHKGNYYLLAEMSSPRIKGDKTHLVSMVDLPATKLCMKFYYNMFGRSIGTLSVYVKDSNENMQQVWTKSGNQGDKWQKGAINLLETDGIQIIIEAVRGDDWDSDIALDEMTLTVGECREAYTECINTTRGAEYEGTLNITESGYTCQAWSSQTPYTHSYGDTLGDQENYCRNPDNDDRPWCYTTSSGKRWEYCNVPRCEFEECLQSVIGYEYQGTVSTTKSGKECQRWDSQVPHTHEYKYLAAHENFCRNPNGGKSLPWCYTTDSATEWDFCEISACPSSYTAKNCRESVQGIDYFGTFSQTASGKTCQRWDTFKPHSHSLGKIGEQSNYCRNPDGEPKPWCYTTDPDDRWETCNIPLCEDLPCHSNPCRNGGTCAEYGTSYNCTCFDTFTGPNCETYVEKDNTECLLSTMGWEYEGTMAVTEDGDVCKNWSDSRFASSLGDQGNFCRNPDKEPRPWCYKVDGGWDFCNITACTSPIKECLDTPSGKRYFGTVNIDKDGFMCKRWDSEIARKRGYGYLDDQENYCRNSDSEDSPWCYTTNPDHSWQNCDIPHC